MRRDLYCLSGSTLKVIALVSMTIDHVTYHVMGNAMGLQDSWQYDCLRGVGRLAFPIFAFLVVEGYRHTHHLGKYATALFLTAAISEVPWYLLGETDSHNVLFTLLLGLVAVALTDKAKSSSWGMLIPSCCIALIATWLNTDYTWHGVGLMIVFFLFSEKAFFTFLFGFPFMMEYGILGTSLGILICLCYNGSRGFIKGKGLKYAFYLYYPLHLMVIWYILQ